MPFFTTDNLVFISLIVTNNNKDQVLLFRKKNERNCNFELTTGFDFHTERSIIPSTAVVTIGISLSHISCVLWGF